ncbi:hypothetical protein ACN9ML_18485 [Dyadobacter endophyticus]|uniref:hypothetical protein n=1 Tax=Dyadobacter endophyticus TaxID=1749036 RepID=UPI003CF9C5D8
MKDWIGIDIETFSSGDIKNGGVYKYVEAEDFDILLFGYEKPTVAASVVDLTLQHLDQYLIDQITNPNVTKYAYNANFERVCLSKYLGIDLDPDQWECTRVAAGRFGFPMNLGATAKAMRLAEGKMEQGKGLIKFFTMPCPPTKVNGGRTRNLPEHAPEKWELFKEYCVQDVVVEGEIRNKLAVLETPDSAEKRAAATFEKKLYNLDQKINDRGVKIDLTLAINALRIYDEYVEKLTNEAKMLSGMENPNSTSQLTYWLIEQHGGPSGSELDRVIEDTLKERIIKYKDLATKTLVAKEIQKQLLKKYVGIDSVAKDVITEMLSRELPGNVRRMLQIRQEVNKTSVKKYSAMISVAGNDGRARGLFQFIGANRTWRWAGRMVQPQNMPKNFLLVDPKKGIDDLSLARNLVLAGDGEALELMYGNVPDTLSQLLRTAFIAESGKMLTPADYAAIEARVIAWLAGETWRMQAFRDKMDIYIVSVCKMFGLDMDAIDWKSPEGKKWRAMGKIAELALGFQGGKGALEKMDSKKELVRKELKPLVRAWRKASPNIVQLWADVHECVVRAIHSPGSVHKCSYMTFQVHKGILHITLPSGHDLCYVNPRLIVHRYFKRRTKDPETLAEYEAGETENIYEYVNKYGKTLNYLVNEKAPEEKMHTHIFYDGLNQTTNQWGPIESYGGKFVENIVQGVARDCLAVGLVRLDAHGLPIVLHVHDEPVVENTEEFTVRTEHDMVRIMSEAIEWAPGLLLAAEGFSTPFYKKD